MSNKKNSNQLSTDIEVKNSPNSIEKLSKKEPVSEEELSDVSGGLVFGDLVDKISGSKEYTTTYHYKDYTVKITGTCSEHEDFVYWVAMLVATYGISVLKEGSANILKKIKTIKK